MSVTFLNTSTNGSQGTTSWSHDNTGGNYVNVAVDDTANTVSGVTIGGVSATQIGTTLNNAQSGRYCSFWGAQNTTSGSITIAISGGANQNGAAVSMAGYGSNTGSTTSGNTGATATIAVTTTIDNAYVVGYGFFRDFSSVGTNTTSLVMFNVGGIFRTTSAVSPAGSSTLTINTTGGEWDFIATGINPVVANTSPSFLLNFI